MAEFNYLDLTDIANPDNGGSGVGSLESSWIDLQRFIRCHATVILDASAEAITVTPLQAIDEAGAGSKPLEIVYVYNKFGTEIDFTKEEVLADTYIITPTTAGVCIIEFYVPRLDINNAFRFIKIQLSGSSARNQGLVIYPTGGKPVRIEPAAPATPPLVYPMAGWTGLENCA